MNRLYFKKTTRELELLFGEYFNNFGMLEKVEYELGFRSRQKAINLREKVRRRLSEFYDYSEVKPRRIRMIIIEEF
jgi:hypothetical protein